MFKDVLAAFLAACEGDAALQAYARKHRVTLHFVITDQELTCHLAFADGKLSAGLGPPPGKPDLVVKMDTETFDGVMSGRVNGAAAAMQGRLRFKGDTMRAMALQGLVRDMNRIYTQAAGGGAD